MITKEITNWLLSSDPAIRWQVKDNLLNESVASVLAEREKICTEGWGQLVLECQNDDGKWSGQIYNGKWISTTYALLLLADFGIIPNQNTHKACDQLFNCGLYNQREIRFSNGQKLRDNGVTGLVLRLLCYFDYTTPLLDNIAEFLISVQNHDGSWFFDDKAGAEKYCFENTLIILRGLSEYRKKASCDNPKLNYSIQKGQEFLLKHNLFQNPATGSPANKKWLKLSFPSYWFYDVLTALDYFREMNIKDTRLSPAIDLIRNKQNKDRTWNLELKHPGKTFFEMEQTGKASKWNTLRCLRILQWWDGKFKIG